MAEHETNEVRVFNTALELSSPAERAAYLDQACAGNPALRAKVQALLHDRAKADEFFATRLDQSAPRGLTAPPPVPITEKPGDKIGRYKLLQQIGEGGCGVVYMAEQEDPVRRRVALKVIRLGMDTKTVVARFEAERQALALMDHASIAKVFDGGATDSGRPYFVMELVRGIKMTEYCDQAQLATEERLKLFIQVCQAVQHAHQKGVIHRDIKPSNILVTVNDGVPVPKVIDFGIAKATDQRLTDKTCFTEFHAFIGTPAYTSPEQAEMSSLDTDTRSDIYSLGVLLYELLTGQTPFPAERLLQSGLDEMRRIIREEEPPPPSTRLTTLGLAEATELGQKRQAKIPQLASTVRGDLDWIVMKALEKDRTRRYATSLDLAADLQRHLNHEPVLARAPGSLYKLQKLIRRNKGAFAATAAVFLALLTGLCLAAWQAVRATKAEHAARMAQLAERAQSEKARADRDRAVLAESNATDNATEAAYALQTARERMVKLNVSEGWRRVEEGDHFGALLPFAEAFALEQNNPDRAELHQMRLASVLQRSPKLVSVWSVGTNIRLDHARFSRNGTQLITSGQAADDSPFFSATIWDLENQKPVFEVIDATRKRYPHWIALSGDEKLFVTASHQRTTLVLDDGQTVTGRLPGFREAQVWNAMTRQAASPPIQLLEVADETPVLNHDGTRYLLIRETTSVKPNSGKSYEVRAELSLWDTATRTNLWRYTPEAHPKLYDSAPVVFSADGRLVVFGGGIVDAQTGKRVVSFESADSAEFSPDGARLFTAGGSYNSSYTWASLRDGGDVTKIIREWNQRGAPYLGRFSLDGTKLATANDDLSVRIWNGVDGLPVTSPMEHEGLVADVCFSSDGAWLATGMGKWADEGYAQVWNAESGEAITPRLPHHGPVLRVAFSKDNTRLFVAGENGTVAVWSLAGFDASRFTWSIPGLGVHYRTAFPGSERVRLSSDGKTLISKSGGGNVWRGDRGPFSLGNVRAALAWNLSNGEQLLPPLLRLPDCVPIDPLRAVECSSGECSVVDLRDGSVVTRNIASHFKAPNTNAIWAGQFFKRNGWPVGAAGRWIVAHQDGGNEILVVDATSGALAARLDRSGVANQSFTVGVRPDGKQVLATAGPKEHRVVARWNVETSDKPEMIPTQGWYPFAYTRSGKLAVFDHEDYSGFKLFETGTFQEVLLGDDWAIDRSSIDDRWILAYSDSFYDRWQIHSATNPSLRSPLLTHRGGIHSGDFTTDDRIAMTTGADLKVRFWSVPDAEPILLPVSLPSEAMEMEATGDARGFITVHADDTVRFWELPKGKRPVSDWLALARFFARGPGAAHGVPASAGPASAAAPPEGGTPNFRDEWLALRAKHPEVFTVSADEIDAWHRHEAWRCESRKDWSNAVVHLTRLLETHPDSGDFLPRRAAACVAWAAELAAADAGGLHSNSESQGLKPGDDQGLLTPDSTQLLERALADYNRTLAWVDRFPAIARESRKPFLEQRRNVYLKLGRKAEAMADERELKATATAPTQL